MRRRPSAGTAVAGLLGCPGLSPGSAGGYTLRHLCRPPFTKRKERGFPGPQVHKQTVGTLHGGTKQSRQQARPQAHVFRVFRPVFRCKKRVFRVFRKSLKRKKFFFSKILRSTRNTHYLQRNTGRDTRNTGPDTKKARRPPQPLTTVCPGRCRAHPSQCILCRAQQYSGMRAAQKPPPPPRLSEALQLHLPRDGPVNGCFGLPRAA